MFKSAGISLLELLVTMAVLGVLVCFGVSFAPLHQHRLYRKADEIKSIVGYATREAMQTGVALTMSPWPSPSDWSKGMVLFVDNNVSHQYNSKAQVIRKWRFKDDGVDVFWQGFQSKDYLFFSPKLYERAVNGSFVLKNALQQQLILVINRLGHVRYILSPEHS